MSLHNNNTEGLDDVSGSPSSSIGASAGSHDQTVPGASHVPGSTVSHASGEQSPGDATPTTTSEAQADSQGHEINGGPSSSDASQASPTPSVSELSTRSRGTPAPPAVETRTAMRAAVCRLFQLPEVPLLVNPEAAFQQGCQKTARTLPVLNQGSSASESATNSEQGEHTEYACYICGSLAFGTKEARLRHWRDAHYYVL